MSWTTPKTFTSAVLSSTEMNTHLRDNLQYLYDRGIGAWVDVPYNAGNFTSDTGTWTVAAGDHATFKYSIFGKMMWVQFHLVFTSLSGAGVALQIAIPGGVTTVNDEVGVGHAQGTTTEFCVVVVVGTVLQIMRAGSTTWPDSVNLQTIRGQIWFEIA